MSTPSYPQHWLAGCSQNHEAEHVADIGMADASDTAIWEIATVTKAVIITKDEDFAQRRNLHNSQYPAIVWLRIGNTRRAELLQWFSTLMPQIIAALQRGETLIEVD